MLMLSSIQTSQGMLIEDELGIFFILNILIPTFGIPIIIKIISWNGFSMTDVMIKDIE